MFINCLETGKDIWFDLEKDYCKQKEVEMASSSTLADKGSGVVGFPVPKLSTGSISRQF